MEFYHLHVHNEFSQLDGLGTAEQYAEEASRLGFKYLGITNHGNIDGVIKFQKACEEKGIKVIHGCELYIVDNRHSKEKGERRYHLTAFIKDKCGWESLLKMLSIANVEGYYRRPRVDIETVLKHTEGLVFASACSSSFINAEWGEKFLTQLKDLVAGDVYLEIMPHETPEQKQTNILAYNLSKKHGIPLVATNDCHYPTASGAKAQEVLLAIQSKAKWKDPNRWRFNVTGLYLKTQEEMELAFDHQNALPSNIYRRALANTKCVVEKCCNFRIERLPVILPKVPGYEDRDETELLRELIEIGYGKRILNKKERINRKVYRERIEEEFELICKLGFQRYFLIVWELINWCKNNDILVGVGRGSSGGSLIAFLLGITGVDPLKYGLLFSRFISPARIDLPDIDMDFEDIKRDKVREHLEECYGKECVVGLSTFMKMKGRAALRDVARVFDIPYKDVDAAAKSIVVRSGGDFRCLAEDTKVCTPEGEKEISSIVSGDFVLGFSTAGKYSEFREVSDVFNSGEAEVFEIEFDSDRKIICTEDHKIFVNGEWKMCKDISIGDYGIGLDSKCTSIKSTGVKTIKSAGCRKCYDISLSGREKGFFANGILVHNSDFSVEDAFKTFEDGIKFRKKYPEEAQLTMDLEGQIRGSGQHAAAICISNESLYHGKRCNLCVRNGKIVANWDKHDAEYVGLMKLDVLGLSTLTILNQARAMIKRNYGIEIDFDALSLDDEKVYEMISKGHTVGLFQIGSMGLSSYCKELGVENFEMLVHATSLWRPGTLRCVTGDTEIYCWSGKKVRIDEIDIGRPVKSSAFPALRRRKYIRNKVEAVIETGIKMVYELVDSDGESIKTSAEHKFFVKKKAISISCRNEGAEIWKSPMWMELKDIRPGDMITKVMMGSTEAKANHMQKFLELGKVTRFSSGRKPWNKGAKNFTDYTYNMCKQKNTAKVENSLKKWKEKMFLDPEKWQKAIAKMKRTKKKFWSKKENRKKHSEAMLKYYGENDHPNSKGINASKPQREIFEAVKLFFIDAELDYRFNWVDDLERKRFFNLDVAIPEKRINIEFDGEYWHDNPGERVEPRDALVEQAGWTVIRLTEKNYRQFIDQLIELTDDNSLKYAKVVSVKKIGKRQTYDLMMENQEFPNYIANNFLVHNSGLVSEFAERKKGKLYSGVHPLVDRLTKDTYGIILYQEQVMLFMYELGGLGWKTCDTVRKVISKSQGEELFMKFKELFAQGCVDKGTLDRATAEKLWEELASFGCLSGDTVIYRKSSNQYVNREMTMHEAFIHQNNPRTKRRKLKVLSSDKDGRIKYHIINKIIYTGKKDLFKITTESGKTIKATLDHRFFVNGRWRQTKHISIGDKIAVSNLVFGTGCKNSYKVLEEKVASISYCAKEDSYDIEMVGEPRNFIANNFVSHNSYGFNKSHAVEYSVLTYWQAYLKIHYPAEFMACSLTYGSEDKKMELVEESRRLGLKINLPEMGKSHSTNWETYPKTGTLYTPFAEIKGVGEKTVENILNLQVDNKGFFKKKESKLKAPGKKIISLLEKLHHFNETEVADGATDEATDEIQELFQFSIRSDSMYKVKGIYELVKDKISLIQNINFAKADTECKLFFGILPEIKYGYRQSVLKSASNPQANRHHMQGTADSLGGVYGFMKDLSETANAMVVFNSKLYTQKKEAIEHCAGKWCIMKANHPRRATNNLFCEEIVLEDDLFRCEFGGLVNGLLKKPACNSLPDIKECQECSLRAEAAAPVAVSLGKNNVLILGEAPGRSENKQGKGFVGSAGEVLWKELALHKFDREDFCLGNISKCFPSITRTPTKRHINTCTKKWLDKEIALIQPKLVLALGNAPLQYFKEQESGISQLNGMTEWNSKHKLWICWCVHPASVLYQGGDKDAFAKGIDNFVRCMNNLR